MKWTVLTLFFAFLSVQAQFHISGQIDVQQWQPYVYIAAVDDYRLIDNDLSDSIIAKIATNSDGYFEFTSHSFPKEPHLYKIFVSSCSPNDGVATDFSGKCDNIFSIKVLANNSDTLQFPLTEYSNESLCTLYSSNPHTKDILRIDSLQSTILSDIIAFGTKPKDIQDKYQTLLQFGTTLEEPLSRLILYKLVSDKSSLFHSNYLKDVHNDYYSDLLKDLQSLYPKSAYTLQYQKEWEADKFALGLTENTSFFTLQNFLKWFLWIIIFVFGVWMMVKAIKKSRKKPTVSIQYSFTEQENKIITLIQENKSNKEIADALFISLSTVKTHINNIYKKTGFSHREDIKTKIQTGV